MSSILDVIIYVFAAIGAAATSYMTLTAVEFRRKRMSRPDADKMWRAYEKKLAEKDA